MHKFIILAILVSCLFVQQNAVASGNEDSKPPNVILDNKYINTLSNLEKFSFQGGKIGTPINDIYKMLKKKNKKIVKKDDTEFIISNFKLSDMKFDVYLSGNSELDGNPFEQFCFIKEYKSKEGINKEIKKDSISLNEIFKAKYGNVVVNNGNNINNINLSDLDENPTIYRQWFDDIDITAKIFLKKKDENLYLWGCVSSYMMTYREALLYNKILDKQRALEAEAKRLDEEAVRVMRKDKAEKGAKGF